MNTPRKSSKPKPARKPHAPLARSSRASSHPEEIAALEELAAFGDALLEAAPDVHRATVAAVKEAMAAREDAAPTQGRAASSCSDPEAFARARRIDGYRQDVETFRQALRSVAPHAEEGIRRRLEAGGAS